MFSSLSGPWTLAGALQRMSAEMAVEHLTLTAVIGLAQKVLR